MWEGKLKNSKEKIEKKKKKTSLGAVTLVLKLLNPSCLIFSSVTNLVFPPKSRKEKQVPAWSLPATK